VQEDFSISVAEHSGCRVLFVSGDVDEMTALDLAVELEDCDFEFDRDLPVIVDLSNVTFISSAGLHVLLRPRPAGRPALVCPPGNVERVLSVVNAQATTAVFPDLESAIAEVAGGEPQKRRVLRLAGRGSQACNSARRRGRRLGRA
jgi:anti-anti-sigma factor